MRIINIQSISNIKFGTPIINTGHGGVSILKSVQSYVGQHTIDYYGTVPASEFFTPAQLSTALGVTQGTASTATNWHKVKYKGQILFYPEGNIRDNISFQSIYQAGAVYGIDGYGKFPAGGNVLQNATVTKDGYTYRVRLFSAFNTDPHNGSTGTNIANMQGSEWMELVYRISSSNPMGLDDNFVANTIPTAVLVKEAFNSDGVKACMGLNGNVAQVPNQSGNATHSATRYWKPILELVK